MDADPQRQRSDADVDRAVRREIEQMHELIDHPSTFAALKVHIMHRLLFQARMKYDKAQRRFRFTFQMDGGD